jgi:hypothetical protein
MLDGPSQQTVLRNKFRSANLMEKYVKHMMQVQNQIQKFHFSGKPKCTTPPQNRWLFVMSQIFLQLTQLQPEDHVKELHELQREFSINYVL